MEHYADLLTDQHARLDPVPSGQFNSVVRILDSQLVGALRAIGAGVAVENGWAVTAGSGLSVTIAPGAGIVQNGDSFIYLATSGSFNLALEANTTSAVYVQAVTRVDPDDPDSREDGTVQFVVNATGEEVPSALLIATVTTGASGVTQIVDERTYTRALTALAAATGSDDDLQAIRDAIGSEYFGANPPLSLDARVDDLESAAAENDGTGVVYWGSLKRAAGDHTTIEQQIAADLQAHVDAMHTDEQEFVAEAEPWDEDSVNQARHALRATRATDNLLPDYLLETVVVVWGVYGDGSGGTPDFIDRDHSTWLPA